MGTRKYNNDDDDDDDGCFWVICKRLEKKQRERERERENEWYSKKKRDGEDSVR